jgi:hypothetical protein
VKLGTIYPGLMVTSAVLYHMAWLVNVTIDIRNVCVFLAPFFSSLTTIVTYLLTKELRVRRKTCLLTFNVLFCVHDFIVGSFGVPIKIASSVHMHETTKEQMKQFRSNFILENFMKKLSNHVNFHLNWTVLTTTLHKS